MLAVNDVLVCRLYPTVSNDILILKLNIFCECAFVSVSIADIYRGAGSRYFEVGGGGANVSRGPR